MMHFGNFGGMGFGGFGFGFIAMILFWGIIIAIGIYFGKKLLDMNTKKSSDDSPEEILKKRYVRGEIGREQYEKMLREIREFSH
jgi:putative membrane protein